MTVQSPEPGPPAPATVSGFSDIRGELHAHLDEVLRRVAEHFGGHHPGKQQQLQAAVANAKSFVDELHDTTPAGA